MKILYNNKVDDATLTSTATAANFPVTNLQDPRLVKTWRSQVPTAQYVIINAGMSIQFTADSFAIISHNLTNSATIRIQGNSVNDWTSPPFNQLITAGQTTVLTAYFASKTYQWWRLYIDDPTNTDGYISIGRLYLSLAYNAPRNPRIGFRHTQKDTTVVSRSITQQLYADIGVITNTYDLSFDILTDAQKQELQGIFEVQGQYDPIILVPDTSNVDKLPALYCVFNTIPGYTMSGNYKWNDATLNFEEVK